MSDMDTKDKHTTAAQDASDDQKGTSKVGTVVKEVTSRTPDDKTTDKEKYSLDQRRNFLMIVTILVSFGALAVSFGSCYHTRRSAEINAASVRAWIAPGKITYQGAIQYKEGYRRHVAFVVKNSGNTPAVNVVAKVGAKFVPGRVLPDVKFEKCPDEVVEQPGVVDSDQEWNIFYMTPPLPEIDSKTVDEGTAHIFVYACIAYNDVLTPDEERLTETAAFLISPEKRTGAEMYPPYIRMR